MAVELIKATDLTDIEVRATLRSVLPKLVEVRDGFDEINDETMVARLSTVIEDVQDTLNELPRAVNTRDMRVSAKTGLPD
jgi:hypothetical protein